MAYGVVGAVASLAVILIGALASSQCKDKGKGRGNARPRHDRFADRMREFQIDGRSVEDEARSPPRKP